MANQHWRESCEELIDEEYDWILLQSDFRSADFVVLGKGAADLGFARVMKALPMDQVLLILVRPSELTAQPYLLIYSPVGAPLRHVSKLGNLKENFWLNFLAGGSTCPSKSVTVHTIKEACDTIDPTGALYLEVNPPPPLPKTEAELKKMNEVTGILADLDSLANSPVQQASSMPAHSAAEPIGVPSAESPATSSAAQPGSIRTVRTVPIEDPKNGGCCHLL